jgi:hypothetical protein
MDKIIHMLAVNCQAVDDHVNVGTYCCTLRLMLAWRDTMAIARS